MLTFWSVVILLAWIPNHQRVLAFQDRYEPDDNVEQATVIFVDDEVPRQHTLHSPKDEDWFKFYIWKDMVYKIKADFVGTDLDPVIELYDSDSMNLLKRTDIGLKGDEEFFSWRAQASGFYYIKVSDIAEQSADCRKNIQYELKLRVDTETACLVYEVVQGLITDAISGKPIANALVSNHCCQKFAHSDERGYYTLKSSIFGLCSLTFKAEGYQFLTCQMPFFRSRSSQSLVSKNIQLFPDDHKPTLLPSQFVFRNGDSLRPSQEVYRYGDNLKVEFDLHELPSYSCAFYSVGMAYPDGRFFMITRLNEFQAFNPSFLPQWQGTGMVVIDKQIADDMPRGDYQLYLLRMPQGIENPLSNLDQGELNVKQFRIE
ncbi:MAG TPA: hypothetical protein EYP59_12455 [Thiotrichaceae bacterium]|nr:hypothetical protein [Thiotrichaceae bacterium]